MKSTESKTQDAIKSQEIQEITLKDLEKISGGCGRMSVPPVRLALA